MNKWCNWIFLKAVTKVDSERCTSSESGDMREKIILIINLFLNPNICLYTEDDDIFIQNLKIWHQIINKNVYSWM